MVINSLSVDIYEVDDHLYSIEIERLGGGPERNEYSVEVNGKVLEETIITSGVNAVDITQKALNLIV